MAYTDTWNAAFEALPADIDNLSEGAERIRDAKLAIRERMQKDHYMDPAGTDADHGQHVKVTLRTGAAPTQVADTAILYAKDVSSKARLFCIDEDGTENRVEMFPSGTHMLFYQDTAPLGWTIHDTLDDKVVMITKGSSAGGQTGGGAHSTGTWTQGTHTHTIAHTHSITIPGNGYSLDGPGTTGGELWITNTGNSHYYDLERVITSGASGTADSGSADLGSTWRPAAYCCIIAAKD